MKHRPLEPNAESTFHRGAFTVVELLVTLVLISAIATFGYVAIGKSFDAAGSVKLESDVSHINASIDIYLASGGSLDGLTDPQLIIDRLKTTRSKDSATRFAGAPASSMIDRRTEAVLLGEGENAPGIPRAIWNISKQRFDITSIGRFGVKEFRLNEAWSERAIPTETRDPSTLGFNTSDGWIWKDKKWIAHRGNLAANSVATNPLDFGSPSPEDPADEDGDGGGGEDDPYGGSDPIDDAPPPPRLQKPIFDPAPGTYLLTDFPMTVSVTNPPPAAEGHVIVRIGNGSWEPYTGEITIPANTYLSAKAISADYSLFRDSYTTSGNYRALVDGFSGSSQAGWSSPGGGTNLVYEVTNGTDASRFAHGDTQIDLGGEILDAGVENIIAFEPAPFADAAPGQRFELGDLIMLNGTTFNDSEADSVNLNIALDLGRHGLLNFTVPFRMENTENSDDRTASADIVQLLSLNTGASIYVANLRYDLALEIESSDSNSEVQGSSFLIYEGATATGKIFGKLIPR